MCPGFVQLILKQVGQRYNPGSARVDKVCCIFGAPATATKQTHAHGGVRGRPSYQRRLDEHCARGDRGYAEKFAAIDFV
jgi:hypothetical protein